MAESITSLARRPAASLLAEASGEHLPSYVTRAQARAVINAATTQTHRLLLECLWKSGSRKKRVYVSADLVAQLARIIHRRHSRQLRPSSAAPFGRISAEMRFPHSEQPPRRGSMNNPG